MNKTNFVIVLIVISGIISFNTVIGQNTIQTPEYASFEPIDAANMVNLIDGDVTYNIPIIYVPSKSGGFPLSLFYQAGIEMEQEASWVGLGWNINSGAINRFVNSFPDDWNNKYVNRVSFIDGFVQESNSIQYNKPLSAGVGITWGYAKSLYDYESFGGINFSGFGSPLSFNAGTNGYSVGFQPDKSPIGINFGYNNKSKSYTYGVNLSVKGTGLSESITNEGVEYSFLGVSLSNTKSGVGISTPIGGFSLLTNTIHNDNLRTRGSGYTIPIPIPWDMSFITYSHMRYESYIYKRSTTDAYGILYSENAIQDAYDGGKIGLQKRGMAMDAYSNPYNKEKYNDSKKNENSNCLTFAAYDQYFVSSQGIVGSISPLITEINNINKEGVILKYRDSDDLPYDPDEEMYYCNLPNTNNYDINNIQFYFNGERSGYRNSGSPDISFGTVTDYLMDGVSLDNFTPENSKDGSYYNPENNRHAGQSYVKWFTNDQIRSGIAESSGFIDDVQMTTSRTNSTDTEYKEFFDPSGIGGFMITAVDGKTYHYAVPVYNFETFNITERTDEMEVNMDRQPGKYAYTWLLTAITGPDYIDKNNNGIVDDSDYGFWIKFNHGKWSDGYLWRSPYTGYNMHNDDIHGSYSIGRKQLYYLNSIETNTHIAYFIKSLREDGLGASSYSKTIQRDKETVFSPYHVDLIPCGITNYIWFQGEAVLNYTIPEKTKKLKLDRIVLLSKQDNLTIDPSLGEEIISPGTGELYYSDLDNLSSNFINVIGQENHLDECCENKILEKFGFSVTRPFTQYYPQNVIDINDLEALGLSQVYEKSLNIKEFQYDYSLCASTPSSGSADKGKLTLLGVYNLSKGGKSIIPPTSFEYYSDNNHYNTDNEGDWGLMKDSPWEWSLKSITNALGSKIIIDYESDSYSKEVIFGGIVEKIEPSTYEISTNTNSATIEFDLPESFQYNDLFNSEQKYLVDADITIQYPYITNKFGDCLFKSKDFKYKKYFNIEIGSTSDKAIINFTFELPEIPVSCSVNPAVINKLDIYGIRKSGIKEGGGIRAKRVSVTDGANVTYSTDYEYNVPGNSNSTSGVTTYSPISMKSEHFIPYVKELPGPKVTYKYVSVISNSNTDENTKVTYEFIVPENSNLTSDNEFTLTSNDSEISEIVKVENKQPDLDKIGEGVISLNSVQSSDYTIYGRSSILHNNSSIIGAIKKTESYNTYNDLISSTKYIYSNNISHGYVNQTFIEGKVFRKWTDCPTRRCGFFFILEECDEPCETSIDTFYITSYSKVNYPINLVSKIDNSNNNTIYSYYEDFDPLNGNANKIRTVNGNNSVITYSLPAYRIAQYASMSSKAINEANANMLTQNAATITVKNGKVIGSNIQTWKGDWDNYLDWNTTSAEPEWSGQDPTGVNIWRKHKTFVWGGDLEADGTYGTYGTDFDNLETIKTNWNTYFGGGDYGNWIKSGEVVRYDHSSTPLEVKDINGDYAATKKDANDVYTIATAANSSLTSFTATSFEDKKELLNGTTVVAYHLGGQVISMKTSGADMVDKSVVKPHTGYYSLKIPSGQIGCKYLANGPELLTGQTYQASVWVHKNYVNNISLDYKIDEVTQTNAQEVVGTFGDWVLVNLDFEVPSTATSFEVFVQANDGICYIDDFRVSPYNAAVKSYTYDNAGNVTAILNNDNFATKYTYDAAGRLKYTYIEKPEGFVQVSSTDYNYAEQFSVTPNTAITIPAKGVTGMQFDVTCDNTDWYISTKPDWIDVSKSNYYFKINVDPIPCSTTRDSYFIVKSVTGEYVKIFVEQEPRGTYNMSYPLEGSVFTVGTQLNYVYNACYADIGEIKLELYSYENDISKSPEDGKFKGVIYPKRGVESLGADISEYWTISTEMIAENGVDDIDVSYNSDEVLRLKITNFADDTQYTYSDYFYIKP